MITHRLVIFRGELVCPVCGFRVRVDFRRLTLTILDPGNDRLHENDPVPYDRRRVMVFVDALAGKL